MEIEMIRSEIIKLEEKIKYFFGERIFFNFLFSVVFASLAGVIYLDGKAQEDFQNIARVTNNQPLVLFGTMMLAFIGMVGLIFGVLMGIETCYYLYLRKRLREAKDAFYNFRPEFSFTGFDSINNACKVNNACEVNNAWEVNNECEIYTSAAMRLGKVVDMTEWLEHQESLARNKESDIVRPNNR